MRDGDVNHIARLGAGGGELRHHFVEGWSEALSQQRALGHAVPTRWDSITLWAATSFGPCPAVPRVWHLDNLIRRSQYLTRRRAARRAPGLADRAGGVPVGRRS